MGQPIRYVIPIDAEDTDAWSLALVEAENKGEEASPPAEDYILLTHAKADLNVASLARQMHEAAAKELFAGRTLELSQGARLRHATARTLEYDVENAAIIAWDADDKILDKLEELRNLTAIIAVPRNVDNIEKWVEQWSPDVHGQQPSKPLPFIDDPVVEKALTWLTNGVTLSKRHLTAADQRQVDATLRILRAKDHKFQPDKIKYWAMSQGWKKPAAEKLAKLAEQIGAIKSKPFLSKNWNWQERYNSWSR
ncbi:hypothetical protein G7A66_00020 [Altererythrobacter sp. SALINAS58]|uniref:hypothetical protein n=1 Tax=Alteripontixanthobacter muriae TaxID=2705546 RepID=UPI001575B218|nr:hypothetical protein [Alteripontixanthobacter muriae]NTZ41503.1 hypothetical protein [Alteripontixanthobacter muriae]